MTVWRLKKGGDRRVRAGHPWVFAGELAHSAREVSPGEVVELRDAQDHFLAYGYAHPTSQICFRKLSARSRERDVLSVDFFARKLNSARAHRRSAGWDGFSHRWLYAEGDGVPGLVVDAYLHGVDWVAVVQASTAGMDRALPEVYSALEACLPSGSVIVEAPTSGARLMEGLAVGEKRVVRGSAPDGLDREFDFSGNVRLRADLIGGQKTGFFLDQQWNIELLKRALKVFAKNVSQPIKILDICCYVGQWSGHCAHALAEMKAPCAVSLLDSSDNALQLAQNNVSKYAQSVEVICGDALKALGDLAPGSFDVVICDPPAFVKKKADLESGLRAYIKLNRDALKLLRPGGLYVAASCSGLVRSTDWREVLTQASLKAGRPLRRLFGGGHGPDHPVCPEFPEGQYLKCEIMTTEAVT